MNRIAVLVGQRLRQFAALKNCLVYRPRLDESQRRRPTRETTVAWAGTGRAGIAGFGSVQGRRTRSGRRGPEPLDGGRVRVGVDRVGDVTLSLGLFGVEEVALKI